MNQTKSFLLSQKKDVEGQRNFSFCPALCLLLIVFLQVKE